MPDLPDEPDRCDHADHTDFVKAHQAWWCDHVRPRQIHTTADLDEVLTILGTIELDDAGGVV